MQGLCLQLNCGYGGDGSAADGGTCMITLVLTM